MSKSLLYVSVYLFLNMSITAERITSRVSTSSFSSPLVHSKSTRSRDILLNCTLRPLIWNAEAFVSTRRDVALKYKSEKTSQSFLQLHYKFKHWCCCIQQHTICLHSRITIKFPLFVDELNLGMFRPVLSRHQGFTLRRLYTTQQRQCKINVISNIPSRPKETLLPNSTCNTHTPSTQVTA